MRLELHNSSDQVPLEKKYLYNPGSWKPRLGVQKRYSKHGGEPTGDEQVDAREINLKYSTGFKSDQAFRDWANGWIRFFRKEYAPQYLVDTENGIRTLVKLADLAPTWSGGNEMRVIDATLRLTQLESLWEDINYTNDPWVSVTNGDQHTIIINDQFDDCYPVFTITAIDDVPEFTINNLSIGAGFTMAHNAFLAGSIMVLDFVTGDFMLNGVLIPQSMTQGGPFPLRPGSNNLECVSVFGDVSIQTVYRKSYGY